MGEDINFFGKAWRPVCWLGGELTSYRRAWCFVRDFS